MSGFGIQLQAQPQVNSQKQCLFLGDIIHISMCRMLIIILARRTIKNSAFNKRFVVLNHPILVPNTYAC